MKNKLNIRTAVSILTVLLAVSGFYGCNALKQISDTIVNLQRLQFKLDNVSNFRIMGIDLSNKSSVRDFGLDEAAKLAAAISNNQFPVDFILNVAANNPNDGSNGTKQSLATLTSFDWKLYIDDVETIAGNINNEITVPGTGQAVTIPLSMNLDLMKFLSNKNLDNIVNLALALGGKSGSAARLRLDARPTVKTPFGPISYPSRITIVNTEFRS